MNLTLDHNPQLSYRIVWARTLDSWPVFPAPLTFTCDEYLGNPEQEFSAPSTPKKTAAFQTPEVAPEEFETAYQWFLA